MILKFKFLDQASKLIRKATFETQHLLEFRIIREVCTESDLSLKGTERQR